MAWQCQELVSVQMNRKPHILESKKITEARNPKRFFILCYLVQFHKKISFYNPINFFAILYPTSLVNLVVEVGTRHCHQILLECPFIDCCLTVNQWKFVWNILLFCWGKIFFLQMTALLQEMSWWCINDLSILLSVLCISVICFPAHCIWRHPEKSVAQVSAWSLCCGWVNQDTDCCSLNRCDTINFLPK